LWPCWVVNVVEAWRRRPKAWLVADFPFPRVLKRHRSEGSLLSASVS
jgi:hypothetical protein